MQSRFHVKKRQILEQLDTPDEQYHDLSPKGSVDEPIRPLIGDINRLDGLVTTSSCSGRVSVFLEGRKKNGLILDAEAEDETSRAGPGGKGGGSWLFISHSPIESSKDVLSSYFMKMFGFPELPVEKNQTAGVDYRYIHLKFEPMVSTIGLYRVQ
jgi:tRNA wybutosine-synthesizing protein 3